jgi:hypothetical protein
MYSSLDRIVLQVYGNLLEKNFACPAIVMNQGDFPIRCHVLSVYSGNTTPLHRAIAAEIRASLGEEQSY